jgi:hypothetical protein
VAAAIVKELPKAYERGYVLNVSERDKATVLVNVQTNAAMEGSFLHLFVHTRNQVKEVLRVR